MNYPYSRIPKNYSYLPHAAAIASHGINELEAMGDRETKRKREAEEIAQLKVDTGTIEQAREQRIVEAATEYMEAAGLPNDDAGRRRAEAIASSTYYPLTGKERKDPSAAAARITALDETWQKILGRAKMERYKLETAPGQRETVVGGQAGQPQGNVGVEDEGIYRTISAPTSQEDYVAQANQESFSQPRAITEVSQPLTAEEKYQKARDVFGPDIPQPIQSDIGYTGRQELVEGQRPTGTTSQQVVREAVAKPIVTPEMGTFAGTYPAEPKPLNELEQANLAQKKLETEWYPARTQADINAKNAQATKTRSGGQSTILDDLIARKNAFENTKQKYVKMMTDRRTNPEQLTEIDKQIKSLDKAIGVVDRQVQAEQKRINLPSTSEPIKYGPSEQATKAAEYIRKAVSSKPPPGFKYTEEFGEPSYSSKVAGGKPMPEVYQQAQADQVIRFANTKGVTTLKPEDVIKELKNSSLEDIIDAILTASKGRSK